MPIFALFSPECAISRRQNEAFSLWRRPCSLFPLPGEAGSSGRHGSCPCAGQCRHTSAWNRRVCAKVPPTPAAESPFPANAAERRAYAARHGKKHPAAAWPPRSRATYPEHGGPDQTAASGAVSVRCAQPGTSRTYTDVPPHSPGAAGRRARHINA